MKREAAFNSLFNKWVKNVYKQTAAFELKQSETDSLPFSSVKPHQVEALVNVKHGVFVYKIVDAGYQNPFDGFCLAGVPAFVVVKYPGFFCLLDIDVWLAEEKVSVRRSLTAERARELSPVVVVL